MLSGSAAAVRVVSNPAAAPRTAPPAGRLTGDGFKAAGDVVRAWPRYAPTPLRSLAGLAHETGLERLSYKDEAERFGLGSFKPVGAGYAAARALQIALAQQTGRVVALGDIVAGRAADAAADVTLVAATDGNHGRAIAWAARAIGARAQVFLHAQVTAGRRAAIEALGAETTVVPGGYDDSVRAASAAADGVRAVLVQDTTVDGRDAAPTDIAHGYGVLADEIVDALVEPPSHVVVQAGVGGFAAALCARFWMRWGAARPFFITLEPREAACVAESLATGRPVVASGSGHSAMAGLACSEVSDIAWEVLATGADAALVVDDAPAFEGMRRLAVPIGADPAIVAGECAGGAVGALLAISERADLRELLRLTPASHVLLIGTEGATDPDVYADAIAGRL